MEKARISETLNEKIYAAIDDMFKNGCDGRQYGFAFGDHYISLTSDCNDEECIIFNLCERVDIFNEPMGEILYTEWIYKSYTNNDILSYLNIWLSDCYQILLDKELKTDYEYQTEHEDSLENIHDMLFDEYDRDQYKCCYSDTFYIFPNEIVNSGQIGEITSYFYKSYFNDKYSSLYDLLFELSKNSQNSIIKDYSFNFGNNYFSVSQCCNGHWYIRKTL